MATIKVRVQGEIATTLTPEVKLVCQNDKYDVEFEFDESWSNSNFKTALFIYNGQLIAIPFDGTICKIPALFDTQLLHIGVKSNDIEGLHTTTPAKVVYLLSANDLTSNKIPEPSKDVYDEIIALLNKYISGGGSVDLSDYQKKFDENLPTTNKTIVGAIAEVKEIAETEKMVFGETEGTAYEGNKGKANADNIAKLQNELSIVNATLEQSGLVKKYKQPITQEYNERVTADGSNVLDGSKAVLKKVVGSTVSCKNLIPYPYVVLEGAYAGLTYKANVDGSFLLKGKSSNAMSITLSSVELLPNTYYFKNSRNGEGAYAFIRRANGTMISHDNSFVVEEKETVTFGFYTGYENEVDYIVYPMLSVENISWQPYFTGLKSASFAGIESGGKNLIPYPYAQGNMVVNGITYTFNNDGSIRVFGTATSASQRTLATNIPSFAGRYCISGSYVWLNVTRESGASEVGTNREWTLNNGDILSRVYINIPAGTTVDTIIYPQLEHGTTATEYTPYISPYLFDFPKTEMPLGKTIDFEQKKITEEYAYLEQSTPFTEEQLANYTDYIISQDGKSIMYKLTTPIVTDFTTQQSASGNEYIAYKGGTEIVLENDGNEYGADNTLTQDYILVTAVE